jgi:hypothetical protein
VTPAAQQAAEELHSLITVVFVFDKSVHYMSAHACLFSTQIDTPSALTSMHRGLDHGTEHARVGTCNCLSHTNVTPCPELLPPAAASRSLSDASKMVHQDSSSSKEFPWALSALTSPGMSLLICLCLQTTCAVAHTAQTAQNSRAVPRQARSTKGGPNNSKPAAAFDSLQCQDA